ncbi:MAG: hypothetical protein ACOCYE_14065 [Pseudomonadota bacterium]
MRRPALAAAGLALLLAACSGPAEPEFVCPRVAAVAGLDRLDYSFAGAPGPVRARLDVIDGICRPDGPDAFLVESAIAIRLDANRPAGEFRIPLSLAVSTPEAIALEFAEFVTIPPGSDGVVQRYEHRVEGIDPTDGASVRLLYALAPDDTALERIAQERPRPR